MIQSEREKIKRFVLDQEMYGAIKAVLTDSFKKEKEGDIYMKAAQMVALNLLEDGFKELKRISTHKEPIEKETGNPGL